MDRYLLLLFKLSQLTAGGLMQNDENSVFDHNLNLPDCMVSVQSTLTEPNDCSFWLGGIYAWKPDVMLYNVTSKPPDF